MIIANISVFPIGKGSSMSESVSAAVEEADRSGLDYRLTAMGTIVEGEWDEVFRLVKKMRERVLKKAERVYLAVTVDDRNDKHRRLEAKVKSVETRLSKSLRK